MGPSSDTAGACDCVCVVVVVVVVVCVRYLLTAHNQLIEATWEGEEGVGGAMH